MVGNWTELPAGSSSGGISLDDIEKTAWSIADSIWNTVKNANGQVVEKTVKIKTTDMSKEDLKKHVSELLRESDGLCNVTGLRMLLHSDKSDSDMAASPDRIDSSLGYVKGNIQMVCWFVNRWKGVDSDDNFRRLIEVVRGTRDHNLMSGD